MPVCAFEMITVFPSRTPQVEIVSIETLCVRLGESPDRPAHLRKITETM